MTLGSGFIYTYWDPAANNYLGEIMIRSIDPRRMILDPGVIETENLRYAAYVVVESFDTLANIRQRFPGRGMLVKSDKKYSAVLNDRNNYGRNSGILSAVMRSMPTVLSLVRVLVPLTRRVPRSRSTSCRRRPRASEILRPVR